MNLGVCVLVGLLLSLSQYYCLYKGPSERLSVAVNVLFFLCVFVFEIEYSLSQ